MELIHHSVFRWDSLLLMKPFGQRDDCDMNVYSVGCGATAGAHVFFYIIGLHQPASYIGLVVLQATGSFISLVFIN